MMRRSSSTTALCVLSLTAITSACGQAPQAVETETTSNAIITTSGAVFETRFDGNQNIRFTSRACFNEIDVAHPTVGCDVAPEDVLVGGSAHTTTSAPGAFLTASYPDAGLTRWTASSKDHELSHPHRLYVFSFGLRIEGMTPAQLRAALTLTTRTSSPAINHPKLQATTVPSNQFLLSTGGKVNWTGPGNLLTGVWDTTVAGKDHVFADPATITMYELRINRVLRIGNVDRTIEVQWKNSAGATVDSGSTWANVRADDGFAPAGAFGYSVWWNPGRLLVGYGYHPGRAAANGFETWTKDHLHPAKGQALAGITQIRLQ